MKKLTMILSLVVLFAFTASAYAQTKGETQFGLNGPLFENSKPKFSGAKSGTVMSPQANVRYLVTDKIGVNVGLAILKYSGEPFKTFGIDKMGINLGLGGRYYYYAKDKMRINGGLDLDLGFGKLNESFDDKGKKVSTPMSLKITAAELEYWPMEGGAITGDLFYAMDGLNLGDNGSTGFGIGLGVKIRIK
ncbi:outer membrane beta-barrel protein [bacterium]|nr:outer membrane beta-barrel protein [bacterium]